MYDFYLDITSTSKTYTDNTAANFRIDIHPPIQLDGEYQCTLKELHIPALEGDKKAVYVQSNFISLQYINGDRRAIHRVIHEPEEHNTLDDQYRRIQEKELRHLEFRLEDSEGKLIDLKEGTTHLTLHFNGIRKESSI